MEDLMTVVDWSRLQFAMTAIYHWLFVPLTLGLGLIVAIMESIYYRRREQRWKEITKFWMRLFGINFAIGVATGIILEFEFGTNWSNYSWFVGDIFGAPLAIEGLLAFFMEATFIAVMFFGWKKVSPGFHLASTWLTAIGASLSAFWILVANAWMQYPVGMEFDPAQMRNVMDNFWAVAFSPVAINKFLHAVLSGWALGGIFVIAVSCFFLFKKRNQRFAKDSIKVAAWTGLVGIILTMVSGHSSAMDVARTQPMKLAAMEGLYKGHCGEELVAIGILNPDKKPGDDKPVFICKIAIPKMLSVLATMNPDAFVPGIDNLIEGTALNAQGDTVRNTSYAERIELGKKAHEALRLYDSARAAKDDAGMKQAEQELKKYYPHFGYGYLESPTEAVPPVALTFYSFHIMVLAGGWILAFYVLVLFALYIRPKWLEARWLQILAFVSVPIVWICSEAGWVTAEVGRQPWIIQDIMPNKAAISAISAGSIVTTFCIFAAVFTIFLIAEMGIMWKQIVKGSMTDFDNTSSSQS